MYVQKLRSVFFFLENTIIQKVLRMKTLPVAVCFYELCIIYDFWFGGGNICCFCCCKKVL